MKFRQSKIKCEHGMIKGLKKLLTKLSRYEIVDAIIPGTISNGKKAGKLRLTVQYYTDNGIKVLAKGDGLQEVFFITNFPEQLITIIEEL